ncbi:MAG: Gfo/Idh/MocA family oxidoreductase [Gemmataceae bacterium]|nr:Gfo/Idh/MocA family oxidoreductase [Gemmataceae bacterium]
MHTLDRRDFLKSTAAGVTSLSALGATYAADEPNEKVVLAVMGARIRGKAHIAGFSALENVEIAYICDPDENLYPAALKTLNAKQKRQPKMIKDFREALADKEVTALTVAAPDHWHALATIWACQAGKHVYVEKPLCHNVVEGRRMIEAARKYNRVVQVGTQRRSAAHLQSAAEFIRGGELGKVPFARTWIAGHRKTIGKKADAEVPANVDYNLWLGPAAERPFNPNRFHYEWHWNWDYGTGELGNNGIHYLDSVRMILGLDAPTRVSSDGGIYLLQDDRQTPDTQLATFDFGSTCVTWEHRIWAKTGIEGQASGLVIYGEKGTMVFDGKDGTGWRIIDGDKDKPASDKASKFDREHFQNFVDSVRTGKKCVADVEEGHKSTRLCHLGNIAYRLGRPIKFDEKTETIVGDAEANKLLGREYRKGFAVPEKV